MVAEVKLFVEQMSAFILPSVHLIHFCSSSCTLMLKSLVIAGMKVGASKSVSEGARMKVGVSKSVS